MMPGGDLFQRFFVRVLVILVIAFVVFLALAHVFLQRVVYAEWRQDLRQEAHWLALHTRTDEDFERFASAWRLTHNSVRLTVFRHDATIIADSDPDGPRLDLTAIGENRPATGVIAAAQRLPEVGWLVLSRAAVPLLSGGLVWELIIAATLIFVVVATILYSPIRDMRATFRRLTGVAEEVADGHFGATVDIARADELGDLVRAVNAMSERLAETERLNTRLFHNVSHELRSPLGRIQALAETVGLHPDEADRYLDGIREEVSLLDRLIGDLVDVARLEADHAAARHEAFDLRAWGHATLERLRLDAHGQGIRWTARLPEEAWMVNGDPQRLAQAIGNTVDNAIVAVRESPDPHIDVTLEAAAESWRVTVTDNGCGIPAEHLPHVVRRFYRVDEHRDRRGGGAGIGLSLVKAIAESHGGTLSIESTEDAGARVTMTFARSLV